MKLDDIIQIKRDRQQGVVLAQSTINKLIDYALAQASIQSSMSKIKTLDERIEAAEGVSISVNAMYAMARSEAFELRQALADKDLETMEQTELADRCRRDVEELAAERDRLTATVDELQRRAGVRIFADAEKASSQHHAQAAPDQAQGGEDWLGHALDLEKLVYRVESQTVRRAMESAALCLRLLGSRVTGHAQAALSEVHAFLLGEAALCGLWFGAKPESKEPFWWRSHLRSAISQQPAAAPAAPLTALENQIADLFGIGSEARLDRDTIFVNVKNTQHFAELLFAVEREFFMVPGEPDEDFPDEEPQEVCLVNSWGCSSTEQYIGQFRAALASQASKGAGKVHSQEGEVLPCPFCGSNDVSDGEVSTQLGARLVTQSECQHCGALGPYADIKEEPDYGDVKTRAAWNSRAPMVDNLVSAPDLISAAQALLREHKQACLTDPMFALLEMAEDDEEALVSAVLLLDLFKAVRGAPSPAQAQPVADVAQRRFDWTRDGMEQAADGAYCYARALAAKPAE